MFSSQTPTQYLVVLQTSDSVVPSQCCRYTEYPARSRRQAPVASSSVAGGSLSHWNPLSQALLGAMNRLSSRRDVAVCQGASIPDCGTSYLARETTVSTG